MSDTRTRISLQIRRTPGIHFNELVRSLDFAPGQIQYHVRQLTEDGSITKAELYGRTHYFEPEFDTWERHLLALFRRETSRDLLGCLLEHESARPDQVAADLGIARSTLEWHLERLVEQDIVRKDRDSRNHVTLSVEHPNRTQTLLAEVSPSIPDRFLDRFTRLVDSLLEE